MRDGWRETTLGEVADVLRGAVWSKGDEVGGPDDQHEAVVGIGVTAAGGVINRAALKYVSGLGDKAKRLASGDTLMVMSNGNHSRIGNAYPIPDDFVGMPFSAFQAAIRVRDSGTVSPSFLSLLLGSEEHQRTFTDSAAGSTGLGNLKVTYLRAFPITLPPLDEQRRIVDLIAAVDDAVDAADAEVARTRSLEASITAEHFASIEHAERLGALATSRLGKMLSKAANQGEEAPYLRNVNVRWGSIDTSDLKTMPFTEADHTEFALNAGDVLVCEGGEIARAAVLDEDLPGIYFQKAIHRVRCGARLRPHYLQRFLAHAVQNDLLADYVSGSTIKHLTGEKLARVPVPLAELEDQDRLIARTDALRGGADAARDTAEALRTLRSNLLTVLLSGEHEIPSSYDALLGEVA